jgi:putative ABC transport system substrate-binding protein
MRRREFILGFAMLVNAGRASAQDRTRRVGVLTSGGPAIIPGPNNILETILKEKGWIVGRNLQIEYRITGGDTNLSRAYARELIALQPDVLIAVTNTSMAALYAEHSNIPTVFAMKPYPSASGGTKCCSCEGRFVIEQIMNITALGSSDDRLSSLLDRVPTALRR